MFCQPSVARYSWYRPLAILERTHANRPRGASSARHARCARSEPTVASEIDQVFPFQLAPFMPSFMLSIFSSTALMNLMEETFFDLG